MNGCQVSRDIANHSHAVGMDQMHEAAIEDAHVAICEQFQRDIREMFKAKKYPGYFAENFDYCAAGLDGMIHCFERYAEAEVKSKCESRGEP